MNVVAILDRPASKSFARVAVVVEDDGNFSSSGLPTNRRFSEEALVRMAETGYLFKLPRPIVLPDPCPPNFAACWMGNRFRELEERVLKLASVRFTVPPEHYQVEELATVWFDTPEHLFVARQKWVERLGALALQKGISAELAMGCSSLMLRTLPALESSTALVYHLRSPDSRQRLLRDLAEERRLPCTDETFEQIRRGLEAKLTDMRSAGVIRIQWPQGSSIPPSRGIRRAPRFEETPCCA